MSFSAGFARGFHAVDQSRRTKLAERQAEERNRQWEVQNKRVQDQYDREVKREKMTDLAKRYNMVRDDLLADEEFRNEDGSFNNELAMQHPAVLGMMSEMAQDNDALGRAIRKGQNHNGEMDQIEFMPVGNGRVAATMNVTDEEGNVQTRPITANRSTDPDDPVQTFSFDDFDRIMMDSLAPYMEAPTNVGGRENELNALRGEEEAADLPSTESSVPGTPPPGPEPVASGAESFPAESPSAAPKGTPYSSAETEDQVPSAKPELSLREQELENQRARAPQGGNVFERIGNYVKGQSDKRQVMNLEHMLDLDNPRGVGLRVNPERASKAYTQVHDKLSPEDRAEVLDHVREPLMKRKAELESKYLQRPDGSPVNIHHKRMRAEINRINAALDPGVQEQPPVEVRNVAEVATPAKVEKKMESVPEPTPTQVASAVDEVTRPTKRSVRSGKPSNAQLLAAMRLAKKGYITGAQVARYARTGKMLEKEDAEDFQFKVVGDTLLRANPADGTVEPVFTEPQGVNDKDMIKLRSDGVKIMQDVAKDMDVSYTDMRARVMADAPYLAQYGIDVRPEAIARNPDIAVTLGKLYEGARRMDKPEKFWTPEKIGEIRDVADMTWGKPKSKFVAVPGKGNVNVEKYAELTGQSIGEARAELEGIGGGSQDGNRPF